MKEIDRTTSKNIFLSAYWPGQQADEPHIGYGGNKGYLIVQLATLGYSVAVNLFNLFIEPKIRPLFRPAARLVFPLVVSTSLGLLAYLYGKSKGYYQLDEQGNPVHFLSTTLPESLKDRRGVGRKEFLEQVEIGK
jgi:hypothetical protein